MLFPAWSLGFSTSVCYIETAPYLKMCCLCNYKKDQVAAFHSGKGGKFRGNDAWELIDKKENAKLCPKMFQRLLNQAGACSREGSGTH